MKTRYPHNRMKAKAIPQVVVNLQVKYGDHRGTVIIPCYSFAECMQHEMHLNGVAKTERRPLDGWKSVGEVVGNVVNGMQPKCQEKK